MEALGVAGYRISVYQGTEVPRGSENASPAIPWSQYQDIPRGGLLYPPRLQLRGPDLLSFNLTLPGPSVGPLYDWLSNTLEIDLRRALALVWMVLHSHGIESFSPAVLGLMMAKFRAVNRFLYAFSGYHLTILESRFPSLKRFACPCPVKT